MKALVVGCSRGVWDDVAKAKSIGTYDAVYCVKQIGIVWPERFDVWVGLHPEAMDKCEAQRAAKGLPNGYEIVAPLKGELGMWGEKGRIARRVSYRWNKEMTGSAGSGLYGAKVALNDGYDRVVLAGIPMTKADGHFMKGTPNVHNQIRGDFWLGLDEFLDGFTRSIPFMRGKVRSVSGKTMEILGAPTPEWLEESQPHIGTPVARKA